MTELSRATMVELGSERRDVTTVGRPMSDTEVRVLRNGEFTPAGRGEICLRGLALAKAYASDGSLRTIDSSSWLRTGDLGALLDDGSVVVEARTTNVVKILGENVAMEVTERAFRRLWPDLECVCVPHEIARNLLILALVVECGEGDQPDAASIYNRLRGELPARQLPRKVFFVSRLPRLASGKLDRVRTRSLTSGGVPEP